MLLVMKYLILFCACLFLYTGATNHVAAQYTENITPGVELVVSPQHPEPGETVHITLSDYSINTNGATFSWFIDGSEVVAARNQRKITLQAGDIGTETKVDQVTTLPSGATIRTSSTITPLRIDMLIEGDTLAPLFYKGRTIPATGSSVRVTAIPFTHESLPATSYAYSWKVNGKVVAGGAQLGKNSIDFDTSFGKNIPVSVDIYDTSGNIVGSESTNVTLADPELLFYEVNPLRGLSEHAITNTFFFLGEEMQVRAEPYFIDRSLINENPYIEWELNNRDIENPSVDPQEITLRRQGNTGSFTLSFHIRNLTQLLQGARGDITLSF